MKPDSRISILDSAVVDIATHGTRGMRVQRVAKGAGVSVALIYHYFTDRSTLLNAALHHIEERANTYTSPVSTESPLERLTVALFREIQDDAAVRTNSAAWGELRDTAIFDPSLRDTIKELTAQWVSDTEQLVRDCNPTATNAREVAILLTCLVEGISGRWLSGQISTGEAQVVLATGIATLLPVEAAIVQRQSD